jgi:hypothetical protein
LVMQFLPPGEVEIRPADIPHAGPWRVNGEGSPTTHEYCGAGILTLTHFPCARFNEVFNVGNNSRRRDAGA